MNRTCAAARVCLLLACVTLCVMAVELVVPLNEMVLAPGNSLPSEALFHRWGNPGWAESRIRCVGGEAWVDSDDRNPLIAVRCQDPSAVRLRLVILRFPWQRVSDESTIQVMEMTLPDGLESDSAAAAEVRKAHYLRLARANLPGAAWFRSQAGSEALATERQPWQGNAGDDLFDLFTGSRAVAENLALDQLPDTVGGEPDIAVSDLPGIDAATIDWSTVEAGGHVPGPDRLAALISAEQHAVLMPGFQALVTILDEATRMAGGLRESFGLDDGSLIDRYQSQMALEMNRAVRALGASAIDAVAITGGDPSLAMGAEVAVLMASEQPEVLVGFIRAQQDLAAKRHADATASRAVMDGLDRTVDSVSTPDGRLSSHMARFGSVVVVTNSPRQLRLVAACLAGEMASLSDDEDYRALRHRYPSLPEEQAFVILSDATIRRWCSPSQRIAAARRIAAIAVLAEMRGRALLGTLGSLPEVAQELAPGLDMGALTMGPQGPQSEIFGSLACSTPASVLADDIDAHGVSQQEAESYRRWRTAYAIGFREFFDPVAARLSIGSDGRVRFEMSVLPLKARSDYHEILDLTAEARLAPTAGDPHPESILHYTLAINPQADLIGEAEREFSTLLPGVRANPLSWLGDAVSIFLDDDPVWDELMGADQDGLSWQQEWWRIPVAAHVGVRDPIQLTLFLGAVRAFLSGAAPGMLDWQTGEHAGLHYVRLVPGEGQVPADMGDATLCYAALPEGLWLSLNETVIHRVLERVAARRSGGETVAAPWAGATVGLSLSARGRRVLMGLLQGSRSMATPAQQAAWAFLPILNEWRTRFPDEDPILAHERLYGRRLAEPGSFVWDADWGTMKSLRYGHPGDPIAGDDTDPLLGIGGANATITIDPIGEESLGLRVTLELLPVGDGEPGNP